MKEVEKETLCLQVFIEKRVFILNSIAFKTGHSLEVGRQCKEGSLEVFCNWEQDIER